jgi:hypothetical protein
MIDSKRIYEKFGDNYIADEHTFTMGIDKRFTSHFAERFKGLNVLETCTGGGFTTISLAKTASHVVTVEIDELVQKQAIANVEKAGLTNKVSFVSGNILEQSLLNNLPPADGVFIDPDWAVTGPEHKYYFVNSNTQPPADILLNKMLGLTKNVLLILPPYIDVNELRDLPEHELERCYIGKKHELNCLYFGSLLRNFDGAKFYVTG